VLEIRLPPLRERPEDIPLLVESLLATLDSADKPEAAFLRTPEFQDHLLRHPWLGNIRELRNHLERSLALREQALLPVDMSPAQAGIAVDSNRPLTEARQAWTRAFERRYLEEVLQRNGGNVTAAARAAAVDRIYFYRLLWKHHLR
jgi:DNA-binding NtrC family response regulator